MMASHTIRCIDEEVIDGITGTCPVGSDPLSTHLAFINLFLQFPDRNILKKPLDGSMGST